MRILAVLIALALAPLATPAFAVLPDEVLEDPALEARARELSKELRCLVCRNESIDESNAGLARDLRLLLRERLLAGDSDEEAIDFIVDRYGEYVLLRPTMSGANLALWLSAPLMLLLALGIGAGYLRRRSAAAVAAAEAEALSPEESARLKDILGQ
ncbi:cytochrome c-type biogenesis protein [Pseudoruegeria aquimaris]|nr:cytochrome c-type biogenesis protein [Pseudoruegeria aquimaris]